jgi:hypothetical protein
MRCCKAFLALSLLLLATACANVHSAGVAYAPNPPPPPGFRATCSSVPLPLNAYITGCSPAVSETVAVVQARG